MPRKSRVVISERQQVYLRYLSQSRTCPREVADRARIVLFAYDKCNNADIAVRLGCPRNTVREWRNRWASGFDRLVRAECLESEAAFRIVLVETLMENPTSNRTTAERLARDLAAADDRIDSTEFLETAAAPA